MVSNNRARRPSLRTGDKTYLFQKWGTSRSPGISRKAGKVILLNMPKMATMPSTVDARREDVCCDRSTG